MEWREGSEVGAAFQHTGAMPQHQRKNNRWSIKMRARQRFFVRNCSFMRRSDTKTCELPRACLSSKNSGISMRRLEGLEGNQGRPPFRISVAMINRPIKPGNPNEVLVALVRLINSDEEGKIKRDASLGCRKSLLFYRKALVRH